MIVAGQSLAEAHVYLGDNQTASAYLDMAIDMAKNVDVDQKYVDKLINKKEELK
jgi:hypothetical protein